MPMSRAICAARIIGGNQCLSFYCLFSGSIRLCGLPIHWCAGTSNLPVTKESFTITDYLRRKHTRKLSWSAAAIGNWCWRVWLLLVRRQSDPVGTVPVRDEVRVTEYPPDKRHTQIVLRSARRSQAFFVLYMISGVVVLGSVRTSLKKNIHRCIVYLETPANLLISKNDSPGWRKDRSKSWTEDNSIEEHVEIKNLLTFWFIGYKLNAASL